MKTVFPVWSGLLLVFLAAGFFVLLAIIVPDALQRAATNSSEASNEDKVILFMRVVYPSIAADLALSANDPGIPLDDDGFKRVDAKIREFAQGTHIVKVKIFDATGRVIYSADPKQIGDTFSEGSEAILHASRGRAFSDVTFRDTFSGYSGDLQDVAIVSSYLPVRDEDRNIVGIAEIYSERTEVFQHISYDKTRLLSILVLGFSVLGALCFWLMWSIRLSVAAAAESQSET